MALAKGEMLNNMIDLAVFAHVRCAGPLRYKQDTGQLEQLWLIEEYTGSSKSGHREEWRPVPTV